MFRLILSNNLQQIVSKMFKELQDRNDELEARLHGGVADRGRWHFFGMWFLVDRSRNKDFTEKKLSSLSKWEDVKKVSISSMLRIRLTKCWVYFLLQSYSASNFALINANWCYMPRWMQMLSIVLFCARRPRIRRRRDCRYQFCHFRQLVFTFTFWMTLFACKEKGLIGNRNSCL